MFGKAFLKNVQRKKNNNIRRRQLFPLKTRKIFSKSGPDEHYGLAEELPPDDLSLEDLKIQKNDFINKLKDTDIGNFIKVHIFQLISIF